MSTVTQQNPISMTLQNTSYFPRIPPELGPAFIIVEFIRGVHRDNAHVDASTITATGNGDVICMVSEATQACIHAYSSKLRSDLSRISCMEDTARCYQVRANIYQNLGLIVDGLDGTRHLFVCKCPGLRQVGRFGT